MKHKWSHSDDVLTFYLYRYGEKGPVTMVRVARRMGFSDLGSLKMRIKNFAAIDGQVGLENYAKLSKAVYDEYQGVGEEEHFHDCKKIFEKSSPNR
jgi:hypothetical protein